MTMLVDRLGRQALISFRTNPAGLPAKLVEPPGASRGLTYELQGPARALPEPAETVHCLSDAGHWSTTVLQVSPDALVLDRPPWLVRAQQRRAPRVEVSVPVTLEAGRGDVAARLVDLSAGGGGVVIETAVAPLVATRVSVSLPTGSSLAAVVRSRRTHQHRLLRVVGLEWVDPDPSGAHWVEREVARAARTGRRPSVGAQPPQ